MRPTLALFDIDGTLVDTGGAGRVGLEASFRSVFGLDDVSRPALAEGLLERKRNTEA